MADLLIDTKSFSRDDEKGLLEWLRVTLSGAGYETDAPLERAGFLGCWVKNQRHPIWLLVAFVGDEEQSVQWGITVEPQISMLNPANWSKKGEAKHEADAIMRVIENACENDPNFSVEECSY